jgi:hypothetical protein
MKAFFALALTLLATAPAAMALPVFPGAVGYGTNTKAGRGAAGDHIYKVTTLDDSNVDTPIQGSLRYGVETLTGPRVIVFEVSGVIELRKDLQIMPTTTSPAVDHGYLTIAGQTAPFPGITLKNAGIRIWSHDVLIQHISIRPGTLLNTTTGWHLTPIDNRDCLGTEGKSVNNIVIDHISCGWSTDEMATTWWDINTHSGTHTNITFSNNIFAWPIWNGGHTTGGTGTPTEDHGFGVLVGPGASNVSIVRNVMAFAASRNPLIRSQTAGAQVVNNFVYRPGANRNAVMYVGSKYDQQPANFVTKVSAIGNLAYLMRSRDWQGKTTDAHQEGFYVHQDANPNLFLYLNGNYTYQPDAPGLAAFQPTTNVPADQYSQPFYAYNPNNPTDPNNGRFTPTANRLSSDPYANSGGTTWSPVLGPPEYLKWKIVPGAGKFSGQRDFYDAELMREINDPDDDSTWLFSQDDLNGGADPWAPVNVQNTRTFNVPANPTLDDDGDGYTNLEEELQRWAAIVEGRSTAVPTDPAVSKFDTFTDDASEGWTTAIAGTAGSWSVSGKTLVQSLANLNEKARAMLDGSNWTDQVVEAKVDASAFNGTSFVGVFARFNTHNDSYYLALRSTGAAELKRIQAGFITTYASKPAGTYDPLAPHVLRLEVIGNSLRGFVDGILVLSGTDDEWGFTSGKAGVGTTGASAAFDNVFASPIPASSRVTDDFDDHDANGWSMAETGAASWSTAAGATATNWLLNQTQTTGNHRAVRASLGRDQSTQARVRFVAPSDPKAFIAVFARYQDLNNTYYALLRNSSPRTLELKKIVGGTSAVTFGTLNLPANFDLAAWHTLRIDASGDKLTTLKAYLDGQLQLVGSDVDTPFQTGSVAFGSYLTSAQFDDVVISKP